MDNKKEKTDKLIEYLKKETPEEILQHLMNDKEQPPSPADLMIIAKLRKIGLKDEVINVLIQYSLMTGIGMKFSYLERVAKHWLRQKVSTVEEAMKLAKKEHQQRETFNLKRKQEEEIKETQATTDIKSIKSAISVGITNEQLGMFVRSLLYKQ